MAWKMKFKITVIIIFIIMIGQFFFWPMLKRSYVGDSDGESTSFEDSSTNNEAKEEDKGEKNETCPENRRISNVVNELTCAFGLCPKISFDAEARKSIDDYRNMCTSGEVLPDYFSLDGPTPTPLPHARSENNGLSISLISDEDEMKDFLKQTGAESEVGDRILGKPLSAGRCWTETFWESLEHILALIRSPFAIARYGDGEMDLIHHRRFGMKVGVGLANALANNMINFYQALPITTCAEGITNGGSSGGGNVEWLMDLMAENNTDHSYRLLTQSASFVTFSVLFANRNYPRFVQFLNHYLLGRADIVLVCNTNVLKNPPAWAQAIFTVAPQDIVGMWENNEEKFHINAKLIANAYKGHTFILAAGQASGALAHIMYTENPQNQYIDVGSAIDIVLFNEKSRSYLDMYMDYMGGTCSETRYQIDYRRPVEERCDPQNMEMAPQF